MRTSRKVGARNAPALTPTGLRKSSSGNSGLNAEKRHGMPSALRKDKAGSVVQKATNIENQFRYALLRKGLDFIEQANIGPWSCDFLLPDHKIVIEADGEYWHSIPKTIMKDRRKDLWLRSKGYSVLHFEGKRISADPDGCINKVIQLIEKNKLSLLIEEEEEEEFMEDPEIATAKENDDDAEYEAWLSSGSFGSRGGFG
jgi:very-short-patch-repair endonuclease